MNLNEGDKKKCLTSEYNVQSYAINLIPNLLSEKLQDARQ